jgi:hypothetical protein
MLLSVRLILGSPVPQRGMISIRMVANGLHLSFPVSFLHIVELLHEPIKLPFQLNDGTCSGSGEITMNVDGLVHYTGRVHNSGALAVSYTAITSFPSLGKEKLQDITDITDHPSVLVPVADIFPVVIAHEGHVGGTFSLDTRDSTWDKTATDPRIANNWLEVKVAVASPRTDFDTSMSPIDFIDGLFSGATGIFVFSL